MRARMKKVLGLLLIALTIGGVLLVSRLLSDRFPAGASLARDLLVLAVLLLLSWFLRRDMRYKGRRSIETERHTTVLKSYQGAEAAAAGRRLIVLGECFFYAVIAIGWIFFLRSYIP
jgi:uncharacterized membrane protein